MHKTVFLMLLGCFVALVANAQSDKKLTDATLSKNKIEAHLHFLASDELRGRNTPSPEQMIAARYLASQLRSYGVKPLPEYPDYLQPVKMKKQSQPKQVSVRYKGKKFEFVTNTLLMAGETNDLSLDAVFVNLGTETDFAKTDVKGKIVFAICGDGKSTSPQSWFQMSNKKRKMAIKNGAKALIELYRNQKLPWKVLTRYFSRGNRLALDNDKSTGSMPHIWMNDPSFAEVDFWKKNPKNRAAVVVKGANVKRFNTYNIVGYVEGSDAKLKNEYIVYSAHYDHIGVGKPNAKGDSIYNGARDNGVGTVTVLGAAENIAKG